MNRAVPTAQVNAAAVLARAGPSSSPRRAPAAPVLSQTPLLPELSVPAPSDVSESQAASLVVTSKQLTNDDWGAPPPYSEYPADSAL